MTTVVGIDGWKAGWLGVVLHETDLTLHYEGSLGVLIERFSATDVFVVDVPIGLPLGGRRLADQEARRMVGPRSSSVFPTPPRGPLLASSYREALGMCRNRFGFGLSSQSYALRKKILEADELVGGGARLIEGHPEVSFAALKGGHLEFAKRTWNGQMERRRLLATTGIDLPDSLPSPAGEAPVDDVLDAAAMAWTARRVADGTAQCLSDPPEEIAGSGVAIWF